MTWHVIVLEDLIDQSHASKRRRPGCWKRSSAPSSGGKRDDGKNHRNATKPVLGKIRAMGSVVLIQACLLETKRLFPENEGTPHCSVHNFFLAISFFNVLQNGCTSLELVTDLSTARLMSPPHCDFFAPVAAYILNSWHMASRHCHQFWQLQTPWDLLKHPAAPWQKQETKV